MFEAIRISHSLQQQILGYVEKLLPEEACGLLGGVNGTVEIMLPVENELHSRVRFRMAAMEQVQALLSIEGGGWELIGIFHSHPHGPDVPSETDMREHAYPESACVICYKKDGVWDLRAFCFRDDGVQEIELIYH